MSCRAARLESPRVHRHRSVCFCWVANAVRCQPNVIVSSQTITAGWQLVSSLRNECEPQQVWSGPGWSAMPLCRVAPQVAVSSGDNHSPSSGGEKGQEQIPVNTNPEGKQRLMCHSQKSYVMQSWNFASRVKLKSTYFAGGFLSIIISMYMHTSVICMYCRVHSMEIGLP